MSDIDPPPSVLASEAAILEYLNTLPEGTELTESHIHALRKHLESNPDLEPLYPLGQSLKYRSSLDLTSLGDVVGLSLDYGPYFQGDGLGKLYYVAVGWPEASLPGWTTVVGGGPPDLKGKQAYHLSDARMSAVCTLYDPKTKKWTAQFPAATAGKPVLLHEKAGWGEWIPEN
ncbi:hypothetical protein FRC12_001156 [Ceratobasidium sp. 428]|nr:hypothetical protein FRC12_001156 [Ceratobasidium sp. 428]